MSNIPNVLLFASAIIGGAGGLLAIVTYMAHKQNERNDPHRHHSGSMT